MNKSDKKWVATDQKAFFNANANVDKKVFSKKIFSEYVEKEQVHGFTWLNDCESLLDYGCGTGQTMDAFHDLYPESKVNFLGIDMAENAISVISKKYPNHEFIITSDNDIPSQFWGTFEGAYLLHVLHHSYDHEKLFEAINKCLIPGGKFFISDLSSRNPFIGLARNLFTYLPKSLKEKFSDDLVVDGSIPEKYLVSIEETIVKLNACGFKIEVVGYGHLFVFVLGWFDRILPLSKNSIYSSLLGHLMRLEARLLRYRFFQNYAEVFYIECIKND